MLGLHMMFQVVLECPGITFPSHICHIVQNATVAGRHTTPLLAMLVQSSELNGQASGCLSHLPRSGLVQAAAMANRCWL